jgi:hypothetical protein
MKLVFGYVRLPTGVGYSSRCKTEESRPTPEAVIRSWEALLPPAMVAGLVHRSRCNEIYVLPF